MQGFTAALENMLFYKRIYISTDNKTNKRFPPISYCLIGQIRLEISIFIKNPRLARLGSQLARFREWTDPIEISSVECQ